MLVQLLMKEEKSLRFHLGGNATADLVLLERALAAREDPTRPQIFKYPRLRCRNSKKIVIA